MVPPGLHLEFLARQPEILHDKANASACVAKGLIVRAPGHGLRIVRGALGRTEAVIVQEIHLPVAGLDGGDRAVGEVHVVHLRDALSVALFQQMSALVVLEQRRCRGRAQLDDALPEGIIRVLRELSSPRAGGCEPAGLIVRQVRHRTEGRREGLDVAGGGRADGLRRGAGRYRSQPVTGRRIAIGRRTPPPSPP